MIDDDDRDRGKSIRGGDVGEYLLLLGSSFTCGSLAVGT